MTSDRAHAAQPVPHPWPQLGLALLLTACTGDIEVPPPHASPPEPEGGGAAPGGDVDHATAPVMRRLTRDELTATLEALVGRAIDVEGVPAEAPDGAYRRMGEAQTLSARHVEAYHELGARLTDEAAADAAVLDRLMPGCDPSALGPVTPARSVSSTGAALEGPDPSYLACYAGDLWGEELMCPEVTDPDEVKLRLSSGHVFFTVSIASAGVYALEVEASAVDYRYSETTMQVMSDGAEVGTLTLALDPRASDRTYETYATQLDLAAGDHRLRLQKTDSEIYIRSVTLRGPIDAEADLFATERAACADAFVDDFAPRAWRRPLAPDERSVMRDLFQSGMDGGTFFDGLRMALEYTLQSPDFLYHVELGTPTDDPRLFRLTDFELASRLSYLAWGTPPDEELWQAAERGELHTEAQVRAQAERLFRDPRARATVRSFYEQWLQLEQMESLTKDTELFPEFDSDVRAAMREETRAYLDRMIWEEGATFRDVLTSRRTVLPPALAPLYDVPALTDTDWVDLPPERMGLLTHPSLLAVNAKSNGHSPVRRGVFVLDRILCAEPSPPPEGVDFSAVERSTARTTRERFAEHTSNAACSSCHRNIDPIGFTFESFDGIGRFRTHENEVPIDATGGVPPLGIEPGELDGAVELSQALADSDEVSRCLTRHWARHGLGRYEHPLDDDTLESLYVALEESGIRGMLVRLATTRAFLHRVQIETEDGDE